MVELEQSSKGISLEKPESISAEVANAVTHGIATLLSIVGLVLLVRKGIASGSTTALIAYTIYGSSNILLFLASTLYHSLSYTRARSLFQKIDHGAIYLLIAGTYTPHLMLTVGGRSGYAFLALIWLIAVAGISFEVANTNKFPKLSTILYLIMGWCGIFIARPLLVNANIESVLWLLAGGILYSLGTIFYKQKDKPWMHVVWHLFVMAAAFAMFISIYIYA